MEADLSPDQVRDLARYFLGGRWDAVPVHNGMRMLVSQESADRYAGESWRAVFRAAGVHLPVRLIFVAQGTSVMFREKAVCTAVSNNMAKRITAALNNHTPDRRGI
jgi:hypothetical protein